MSLKKHAIFTYSDANCGGFLINHWYRSLADHMDLTDIDVVVIDYGLTDEQRAELASHGVLFHRCDNDGCFVSNLVYRDMTDFLGQHSYDQVVMIDAGDVIFQADFGHLFEEHKDQFRAVAENNDAGTHRFFVKGIDFSPDKWEEMMDFLTGKPMINASTVLAPATGYRELWLAYEEYADGLKEYGADQVFLNYYLHKRGFVGLPSKYNFVCQTVGESFSIRDGVFYDRQGEPIPIVHNAGGNDKNRVVTNFGYGKGYNKRKAFTTLIRRIQNGFACWYVNWRK